MKANEFVKKHGLARTKYWIKEFTEINKLPDQMINLEFLNDLKRLVESHELVESLGGLDSAKAERAFRKIRNILQSYDSELAQAITDVESCEESIMNLIEQLGGYEKAKRELELKEQNSIFQCCTAVDAEMIRSALLQYRRESGLYDVGDWVFYTGRANDVDMYRLKEVYSEHGFAVGSNGADRDFWTLFIEEIRHATDAEIKAGKRMEVGDGLS